VIRLHLDLDFAVRLFGGRYLGSRWNDTAAAGSLGYLNSISEHIYIAWKLPHSVQPLSLSHACTTTEWDFLGHGSLAFSFVCLPMVVFLGQSSKLMPYSNRTITLVVAIATLTSNALSSLLFAQLPDDTYHLASNFSWYLHFANVLSVFGFIGALRVRASALNGHA
jgi:hypothetical protein